MQLDLENTLQGLQLVNRTIKNDNRKLQFITGKGKIATGT